MTTCRVVLMSIVLVSFAKAGAVQELCAGCEWSERGDRSEGVKATTPVRGSGGAFELVSVAYLGERGPAAADQRLLLAFWMPEAGELDEIRVWAPLGDRSVARETVAYVMEPGRREYPAGRADFAWPRGDVVEPLGLPLDLLHVLIRLGTSYLPAVLTGREEAEPAEGYAFVFESSAGIDADCDIERGDGTPVRRMECYEELGGTIDVTWDGRDDSGNPVADGEYVLRIDGDMLAETIRSLETSVTFRHRRSLN